MGVGLIAWLAGCEGPVPDYSPYVRLDGVDHESFSGAFDAATDGSTIEFCGLREGPFSRSGELRSLSIVGCARDYATLDGMDIASVLSGTIAELHLSDLTLTRGLGTSEEYSCGYDGDCHHYRPPVVHGVLSALDINRVAITDSIVGGEYPYPNGIEVAEGDYPHASGGAVTGSDCIVQGNFVRGDFQPIFISPVEPGGSLDLEGFDWGEGDTENGGPDVHGRVGDGTYSWWDLHGVVDVSCDERDGCSFTQH